MLKTILDLIKSICMHSHIFISSYQGHCDLSLFIIMHCSFSDSVTVDTLRRGRKDWSAEAS